MRVREALFALRVVRRRAGDAAILYRRRLTRKGSERLDRIAPISPPAFAAGASVRNGRCADRGGSGLSAYTRPRKTGRGCTPDRRADRLHASDRARDDDEMAPLRRRSGPQDASQHPQDAPPVLRDGSSAEPPPRRTVRDIHFDDQDPSQRDVYEAVSNYIDKRFDELESEKPGKGFVMTIYRRRASSSPLALKRSLGRRRDGLRQVAARRAYEAELPQSEALDPRDLDDLGDFEVPGRMTAAFPDAPQIARAELVEVESLLGKMHSLGNLDSKRDRFFDVLREVSRDGRSVLVFTEDADTMESLGDGLSGHYGTSLGCYSGAGGQVWDGDGWKPVTRDVMTRALRGGELEVLLCTDAASEGLNLQAAGALMNYDLPSNPSRVEQRIGRIDRIGQQHAVVHVVNLFLRDRVDERVYSTLQRRCGLFQHFVGSMQPVLSRARRMLVRQERIDVDVLGTTAHRLEKDRLPRETYFESQAVGTPLRRPGLSRSQVEAALGCLKEEFGFRVREDRNSSVHRVSAVGLSRRSLAASVEALEHDPKAIPLSPLEPRIRELADRLSRPGENLPLVIGAHPSGAFRACVACWVAGGGFRPSRRSRIWSTCGSRGRVRTRILANACGRSRPPGARRRNR